MSRDPSELRVPREQAFAERVFATIERFLHIEAVSGVVLVIAAATALVWANSPAGDSYEVFWHAPFTIAFLNFSISQPLHFWINDGLMTVFFLVIGMEIRREIHEGALASLPLAALPLAAALGGVVVPALLYLALNDNPVTRGGWAVGTATDIAFAVGVLALLGKAVPGSVRVLLLAIAIIDDIVAVAIIAVFHSSGLDPLGLLVAGGGVLLALAFQRIGIASAYGYVVPGAIVWLGALQTGVHPTLAGVLLGLMTPVLQRQRRERPLDTATRALSDLERHEDTGEKNPRVLALPLKHLRHAERDVLPPVVRVQAALHPWVAYGVMPLFALANAGVRLEGLDLADADTWNVLLGIAVALVVGKPLGIFAASWCVVRAGWCRLPDGVTWPGVLLVGCLAGIGFTMAILIGTLALSDKFLAAAKAGVVLASVTAAALGLALGWASTRTARARARHAQQAGTPPESPPPARSR